MAESPTNSIDSSSNLRRYPNIDISKIMASNSEIIEESHLRPVQVVEDKMYVAVGKEIEESKLLIHWALHNSGGRKICIIHVDEPAQRIMKMGPASQLKEHYRELERQEMNRLIQDYSTICSQAGVHVDVLHIEMNYIEKGIVEFINQLGIRKLVMGAAADKHYSKKMKEPKSKKAIYVREQAPIFCHIWFICKGHLVHTREGRPDGVNMEFASSTPHASPNTETGQYSSLTSSRSLPEGTNDQLKLTNSAPNYRRVQSDLRRIGVSTFSPNDSSGVTPCISSTVEENPVDWDEISRSPRFSRYSSRSSVDVADDLALDHHQFSSPPRVLEGRMNDDLYDRLKQSMEESENSKREAYDESIRRRKAEKDAVDAIRRAKALENLYAVDLRRRKEAEEALARGKEVLERMKQQLGVVAEELCNALEHKSSLESQIANSEEMVEDLEQKMFSVEQMLQKYKEERDELQIERNNALQEAEELRKEQTKLAAANTELQIERNNALQETEELRKEQAEAAAAYTLAPEFFSEFSYSEIVEATSNFASQIGEGGYGNVYRGLLRHNQVAIKKLHSDNMQGPLEFQQEVNVLSKLRHPNLVTLIGACPESFTLVYEYLPNGSLEDRLCCKDESPPLSWQNRIRIATELCSALIYLHSCNPNRIVHGDLKPANILLDSNYVSKLSDFGICRILNQNEFSSNNTAICCITSPKGPFTYIDPAFLATGELTPKSDVYSFGIILLRLLTGRPSLGIIKEVKFALEKGDLKNLLDPTAGDWPFVQAQQLAHIAMRCCDMNRRSRPDLASDVMRVLEGMGVLPQAPPFLMNSEEDFQTPKSLCPIFQGAGSEHVRALQLGFDDTCSEEVEPTVIEAGMDKCGAKGVEPTMISEVAAAKGGVEEDALTIAWVDVKQGGSEVVGRAVTKIGVDIPKGRVPFEGQAKDKSGGSTEGDFHEVRDALDSSSVGSHVENEGEVGDIEYIDLESPEVARVLSVEKIEVHDLEDHELISPGKSHPVEAAEGSVGHFLQVSTRIVPAVGGQAGLSEGASVQDGWSIQRFEDGIVKLIRDGKTLILDPSKLFAHYVDRPEALSLPGKVLKFWPTTFAEVLNKGDYFVKMVVDTVYHLMQQAELCCANPLNETAFAETKKTVEGLRCLGANVDWYLPLLQGALTWFAEAELARVEEELKETEVKVVALRAKKTEVEEELKATETAVAALVARKEELKAMLTVYKYFRWYPIDKDLTKWVECWNVVCEVEFGSLPCFRTSLETNGRR